MSNICEVTGRKRSSGNTVSHANNKRRRVFNPNIVEKRFWVASENRWIKLKLSTAAIKTISKRGIDAVLRDMRKGAKV